MVIHNNNFNFLRLVGAALVIFSHCYYVTGKSISEPVNVVMGGRLEASGFGLCIFFFISGFFVTKSACTSKNISLFLKKRIFRIYPALITIVLLTVFFLGPFFTSLSSGTYFSNRETWLYLFTATAIRIRNNLPGVFTEPGFFIGSVNASLWTIALEIFLYASIALFLVSNLIKKRCLFALLSAAIVLTCFLSLLLNPGMDFFYVKYFNLVGIFYLGSFVYISSATKKQVLFILIFSLLMYSPVYFINEYTLKADFLLLVIVSLTVYFIGFAKKIPLRVDNDISYGLYIFAFPIQQAVFKLTHFNPSISLQLALTFAITVPLAFLSWLFIEKPFINLNRKFNTPNNILM